MDKPNQNKYVDTENRVVVTRGEGGKDKIGKVGQLYGDRWKLSFWWWARCRV